MTDNDRNLLKRFFEEVWNQGRRESIAEILAPDAVLREGADEMRGPEGFYPFFDRMRATFSDMRLSVEFTVAEGSMVAVRWSCKMTHTGDGLGFPATGKECHVTGISIVRVADGRLVDGWQNWDMLGLMQQLQGSGKAATYIAAV